jgi:murein DD-endopeptidase MepM/ murein hydrolase activator NlpD
MPDLPKNQTYDTFGELSKTAFDLAGTLPERVKKPTKRKDIDLDKFSNVRQAASGQGQSRQQSTPPPDLSSLGTVTTPYGGRTKFEKFHPGVDVAMKTGQDIPAFVGGEVSEVRTGETQTPNTPGFGNYVVITDEQGNKHRYSHLHNTWVNEGDKIKAGQSIGGAGHSGGAYSTTGGSGTHLDYRIKNAYDKYVNPSEILGS